MNGSDIVCVIRVFKEGDSMMTEVLGGLQKDGGAGQDTTQSKAASV